MKDRKLMPLEVAKKQGWRVLAGPFWTAEAAEAGGLWCEMELAEKIVSFIESEGGRVALVGGTRSYSSHSKLPVVEIWRPSNEMETIEETLMRRNQLRRRKAVK